VTTCPACHSGRLRNAFRAGGPAFLRCRDCGSLFDAQPLSAADAKQLYEGRAYFVKDEGEDAEGADALWGYPDDYLADRELIEAKFDRVLRHLERYVEPGRLLDVGAGPGFLVSAATKRGWDAVGLDLNEWASQHAREELGVEVRVGDLSDRPFGDERFDAVTMMDVVEHVPDPDELLARAAELVRPGGAIALLTPDAGSPVSRVLGRRWPEVRRPGEHMVLFSVPGLTTVLARHGFVASGWHSIGKEAPVATLVADVAPVAPGLTGKLRDAIAQRPIGQRVVELDPRTKFVLYARRLPDEAPAPTTPHRPARVPRRPEKLAGVDVAILDELRDLAEARRLGEWMFDSFRHLVPDAKVLEVGAGIGTFSQMMLDEGARQLLLIEPERSCHGVLADTFAGEARVRTSTDALPDAAVLAGEEGTFDLVVCQNVLEHIGDDGGAVAAMAEALRPGGHLVLLVPAGPRLFGGLDDAYGHWRRYTPDGIRSVVEGAGLEIDSLRRLNALGILGWWTKNRRPGARIGSSSLKAYEALVSLWRPIEDRFRPPVGLSIVCVGRKASEP
jgi:2-polyprenyl-3-methyl-5-hydroxy-6-metoxy-1,4-benzoquinol methylase